MKKKLLHYFQEDEAKNLLLNMNIPDGVIEVPSTYFNLGDVVLDACFASIDSVTIENLESDAWTGFVSTTSDGELNALNFYFAWNHNPLEKSNVCL